MHTDVGKSGRILVIDQFSTNTPQAYTVCIKDPNDWEEIHNYIINENEIDGIPNRRIDCVNEMPFSSKRSVYEISSEEAEILKSHPKIEWVERSSMHNPLSLEQRKQDEDFDRHITTDRFKKNIVNRRVSGNPGTALTFTQWGLYRHQSRTNNFIGSGATTTNADIQYSLTGKHVDIVIMDTGVRWDHPEFLKDNYTSVPVGVGTSVVSRVRDILIHGPSEFGFSWASEGLTAPGTGVLANYNQSTALNSTTFNGSWHGSHVAGTSAGNQFGVAFEANIWSIACIDRSDVGFSDPADGFDYIRVWHKNKPINPLTGRKNPTIVNASWGRRQFVRYDQEYQAEFRGETYYSDDVESSGNVLPAIYYITPNSLYYEFTSKHLTGQTTTDELFDDPLCDDIICVFAAGNSGTGNGKQDVPNGIDYDNQFTSGIFYYPVISSEGTGVDEYFNRPGTPAIAHIGQNDAPIRVGALDSTVVGISSERKSSFSNTGPAIDVWAAGSTIISPWNNNGNATPDPRNNLYYLRAISGTSMATPNVTGVLALYLQSNPSATRVDVRNWLYNNGSVVLNSGVGNPIQDTYGATNPVGAGTSVNYWSDSYGLRGATARILFNPFANNTTPFISGVNITGVSFSQS